MKEKSYFGMNNDNGYYKGENVIGHMWSFISKFQDLYRREVTEAIKRRASHYS